MNVIAQLDFKLAYYNSAVPWFNHCITSPTSHPMQSERNAREREKKKNMVTLTPQFKIKRGLGWGEFVRDAYANFFEANVPAKHKKCHVQEKGQQSERCHKWRHYFCWQRLNRVKMLFLLAITGIHFNQFQNRTILRVLSMGLMHSFMSDSYTNSAIPNIYIL